MLTHIDKENNPTMVDVSEKNITTRTATARAVVYLPKVILDELHNNEIVTKKGPVLQTAIIAGTMGVKKTHELIPFCHPLMIEGIKVFTKFNEEQKLIIDCTVKNTGKTGVEMEALQGVTTAALTVYDMCKAMGHDIVIESIQLISKTGGKKDFFRE